MGQALFILSNALALFASWRMARWLLPASPVLERALAACAGMSFLALSTSTLLGAVGWLWPLPVALALAVCAAGLYELSRRAGPTQQLGPTAVESFAALSREEALAMVAVLGLIVMQVWLLLAKLVWRGFRPEFDDLSYHAPMAGHWLAEHGLVLAPYNYHAYYPGNGELLSAWFMLPTRLDAYASLSGVYWLVLGALVVAQITRQLGAGAITTALAAALFLACRPIMQQASTFTAVDLGGSTAGAAALALALAGSDTDSRTTALGRVWYAGALSGVSIGCKVTYAPVALAVLFWFAREQKFADGATPDQRAPRGREAALRFGLFSLAALLGGGYWYLRNIVLSGNPVFPARVLFFDGPLDAATRETTSLTYQLMHLPRPQLRAALRALLAWPTPVARTLLAGYAISLVALLFPRFRRNPAARRIGLLIATSAAVVLIVASGPFSGTVNGAGADLNVRLRFFLLFGVLGIPLVAYWVDRVRELRAGLVLGLSALIAWNSFSIGLMPFVLLVAIVILSDFVPRQRLPRWLPRRLSPIAVFGGLIALPLLANAAMLHKQPENDLVMEKVQPAWSVADGLPRGSRLAWFSTVADYECYGTTAFGPKLAHVPTLVTGEGKPYTFMHEVWKKARPTWWQAQLNTEAPEQVALEPGLTLRFGCDRAALPIEIPKERLRNLVENLKAQGIDYVLVMGNSRGKDRAWPPQYEVLKRSNSVQIVKRKSGVALFSLRPDSEAGE